MTKLNGKKHHLPTAVPLFFEMRLTPDGNIEWVFSEPVKNFVLSPSNALQLVNDLLVFCGAKSIDITFEDKETPPSD